MKKIFTIFLLTVFVNMAIQAQVGIGTSSPNAAAALDITSTDKGLLMPRMSTDQRNAIVGAVDGLMVFDTDTKSLWTYTDAEWKESEAGVGKFVEGAANDIAYYDGRVGMGIDAFSTIHRMYVENVKDENRNTSAVIRGVYSGTGNAEWVYGSGSVARNNSTGTVGFAIGSQRVTQNPNSGGSISTAVGSYPQINNSGTINYASAAIIDNWNRAGGTLNTGRGMDVTLTNEGAITLGSLASFYATNKGTITNAYGLFIGGEGAGSVLENAYALYVSTPYQDVGGTSYAIYSDNTANSYIEGNLGVGTNDPQQKVHISGVLRLEPQSTPPTGDLGDLYAGDDNKLYFHDGTSWKEIQLVTP